MSSLPDNLRVALEGLNDSFFDELEKRRANKARIREPVEWKQGPDPYGIDWAWLTPEGEQSTGPNSDKRLSVPAFKSAGMSHRRWLGIAGVIAASLIIGLFVGHQLNGPAGFQVAKADADTNFVTQRGVESLEIRVGAPFQGFATVISLTPEGDAEVFPGWGDAALSVPEGSLSEAVAIAEETTRIVFVVTETPAAEPIRLWLEHDDTKAFGPNDYKQLLVELEEVLQANGYRRIAVGSILAPKPEKKPKS